jgi:hypothetical protein
MPDSSALLIWEKIQPLPKSNDIEDALRCEVHDPLWLLARQWQMGEFKAEDAGMAAFAHINALSCPVQRLLVFNGNAISYDAEEKPINSLIEQISPLFDLSLRLEAGRKWQKMLIAVGKQQAWDIFRQNPILQFKTILAAFEPDNLDMIDFSHEPYEHMIAALGNGRMIDGALLFKELQSRKASDFLPQPDPIINETGNEWLEWVLNRLGISGTQHLNSWNASRLEYSSVTSTALPNNNMAYLHLPEYNGLMMDSFSWEQGKESDELKKDMNPGLITRLRHTFIPTPVSFPGMPRARWWEFEDSTIELSNLQAKKTDLSLLLLSEFGLQFSNDWLLTPLTLPVGSLTHIQNIKVTDVFGVQSTINATQQNNQWEIFQLTTKDVPSPKGWLYIPAITNRYLQSELKEEINFIRDEMANLVWAIENIVPNGLGEGVEGRSLAQQVENWLKVLASSVDVNIENPPVNHTTYSIGNTVPPHWIPFIPIRPNMNKPQIVFRRAAMPRLIAQHDPTRIRPRSQVLRCTTDNKGHYDILEEEIPSTGLIIRQMWRRARWFDGRTVTWLAREKIVGRSKESSGLQFDTIK